MVGPRMGRPRRRGFSGDRFPICLRAYYRRSTSYRCPGNVSGTRGKALREQGVPPKTDAHDEQAARWYALALLSYAVREHDITVAGPNNTPRPITFEEFTAFIAQDLSTQKTRAFQEIEAALTTMTP